MECAASVPLMWALLLHLLRLPLLGGCFLCSHPNLSFTYYVPIPRTQFELCHFILKTFCLNKCISYGIKPKFFGLLASLPHCGPKIKGQHSNSQPPINCCPPCLLSWMSDTHGQLPPGHLILDDPQMSQTQHIPNRIHYFPPSSCLHGVSISDFLFFLLFLIFFRIPNSPSSLLSSGSLDTIISFQNIFLPFCFLHVLSPHFFSD